MKIIRLDELEQYVLEKGSATMPELCDRFGVSMNTIRRDIAQLLRRGTVEKVYGGVSARQSEQLASFAERTVARSQGKQAIGVLAARYVEDGDIIFVDSGTTTMYIVQGLAHLSHVTVLTNSLQCINLALPYPNISVLALPGQLQRATYSFTGMETLLSLRKYHIKKCFMAATAVSLTDGVTNSSSLEYEIKRTAMQQSQRAFLLADQAKFDRTAMLTYARLTDFACVMTDVPPPPAYRQFFSASRVELAVAADA